MWDIGHAGVAAAIRDDPDAVQGANQGANQG